MAYRSQVDARVLDVISAMDEAKQAGLEQLITLGLHHEQQHQELLLTDIPVVQPAASGLRQALAAGEHGPPANTLALL